MTAGLVSGYNLAKFAKDVVLKKGPAQIIVQDLSMASADVNGDLNVAGQIKIGGVNFNNVVALNATETVRGKSSMLKDLAVLQELHVLVQGKFYCHNYSSNKSWKEV